MSPPALYDCFIRDNYLFAAGAAAGVAGFAPFFMPSFVFTVSVRSSQSVLLM
jgi:hypothetical protein